MLNSMGEIFAALRETAARLPGSVAVASPGGYVTYGRFLANLECSVVELVRRGIKPGQLVVVAVANPDVTYDRFIANLECSVVELVRRGIKPGQLVVVAVANPDVTLVVVLALMWIGCRVGYARDLRLYDASKVPVDAVVVDRPATGADNLIQVTPDWFKGDAAGEQLPPVAADCSLIAASSGSTGQPKLIEIGTQAVLRRLIMAKADFEQLPRERYLALQGERVVGPLINTTVVHLTGGMVIRPRDRHPATVLATMQLYRPDYMTFAPAALVDLLAALDARPMKLDKVAMLRSSGAYFAPDLRAAALERIAEEVFSHYGSTEAGWIAVGASAELDGIAGSVGRIFDDVEVAAFDGDDRRLAPGNEGELRVKLPEGGMGRYLEADAAQDSSIRDGWFVTGDIGLVDEDRNMIVRGRASNVINVGGNKVNPEQLEECLRGRAGVVDVGVAGVTGAQGVDRIGAAIVANGALTIEAVNEHLVGHGVRRPVQVLRLVSAIPRTTTGKIDRPALKRQFDG